MEFGTNLRMLGCHPGQLSFIICAASDTLPTAVNLQCWHIQCDAKCHICGCVQPTTVHILSGCPAALSQERLTYQHDQVFHCLASGLSEILAELNTIHVYADLPVMGASKSLSLMETPYHPDIVIYNETCNLVALLAL